jgi:hypothetical protein
MKQDYTPVLVYVDPLSYLISFLSPYKMDILFLLLLYISLMKDLSVFGPSL